MIPQFLEGVFNRDFGHAAVIEGAFVEKAAAAGDVSADDPVDATEGAFPPGLIGAKENQRRCSNQGGQVRDGAVVGDEDIAGGEKIKEVVSFQFEIESRVAEGLGESDRRSGATR